MSTLTVIRIIFALVAALAAGGAARVLIRTESDGLAGTLFGALVGVAFLCGLVAALPWQS